MATTVCAVKSGLLASGAVELNTASNWAWLVKAIQVVSVTWSNDFRVYWVSGIIPIAEGAAVREEEQDVTIITALLTRRVMKVFILQLFLECKVIIYGLMLLRRWYRFVCLVA